ncbi:MAG: mannose-1-phosphate guanylyltransferase [Lachnospiraceae bacterium]|nr:mannose-1-phosphate guanylyltransferase [Lachnospiraceae bacterium]
MKTYGVIMAGGGGTRFWPLSRKERPKQLLNLSGRDIMVNETIDRIAASVGKDNIFIVTNETQAKLMETETAGRMDPKRILAEPAARNTAACIGYAAMEIVKKYEDGIMCILPSDQFVKDTEEFTRVMDAAILAAEETDMLVTIGIHPTFPATGYGYICTEKTGGEKIGETGKEYFKVKEFVEKPDLETAENYLADGNYAWNSGMFIWKASTILKKFEALLPDIYECIAQIGDAMGTEREAEVIQKIYPEIPKISIDYGIMERSRDVIMIEGDFGWNDIGSLDMLGIMKEEDENGNVIYGEQINLDTQNCILYGTDKLIATIGVENLIVIQEKDAVLICAKERAQDVKKIVDTLSSQAKEQYL